MPDVIPIAEMPVLDTSLDDPIHAVCTTCNDDTDDTVEALCGEMQNLDQMVPAVEVIDCCISCLAAALTHSCSDS